MKRKIEMTKLKMLLLIITTMFFGCNNPFLENINTMNFSTSDINTYPVKQLTFDSYNHFLSPYGAFSPDDEWLVYDTRTNENAMGSNSTIEKVNVKTGERQIIYQTPNQNTYGPGCGTPTYHPKVNQIIFIHGINNADQSRPYDLHRRTCVMTDETQLGKAIHLDARDVIYPFTPGALRGGTHAHQFSGDGNWIGFTYNDALMADFENQTGYPANLRTVGIMTGPNQVNCDNDSEDENNDGQWFSALVAKVVPFPAPGTNQISRAFSNAWVGEKGYQKPDGTYQRAQAYLGKLKSKEGHDLIEIYISDIPNKIDIPGPLGPLEGTKKDFPMPPKDIVQKRLTYTENRKYPGVSTTPRHWLLSSSDGQYIAYLAKDDQGIVQIFVVSPLGLSPIQITFNNTPVQSTFFWKPNSHKICYVTDNSLFLSGLENNKPIQRIRLTKKFQNPPFYPCWSHDGNSVAFNLDQTDHGQTIRQIFISNVLESTDNR